MDINTISVVYSGIIMHDYLMGVVFFGGVLVQSLFMTKEVPFSDRLWGHIGSLGLTLFWLGLFFIAFPGTSEAGFLNGLAYAFLCTAVFHKYIFRSIEQGTLLVANSLLLYISLSQHRTILSFIAGILLFVSLVSYFSTTFNKRLLVRAFLYVNYVYAISAVVYSTIKDTQLLQTLNSYNSLNGFSVVTLFFGGCVTMILIANLSHIFWLLINNWLTQNKLNAHEPQKISALRVVSSLYHPSERVSLGSLLLISLIGGILVFSYFHPLINDNLLFSLVLTASYFIRAHKQPEVSFSQK